MRNNTTVVLCVLFAVLAVVFAVLFLSGNGRIGAMNREKDELAAEAEVLRADAVKAEETSAVRLQEAEAKRSELASQVETLKTDASKAAEDAAESTDPDT